MTEDSGTLEQTMLVVSDIRFSNSACSSSTVTGTFTLTFSEITSLAIIFSTLFRREALRMMDGSQ